MSRSYKNSPVVTCGKNSTGKREAARAVRKSKIEGRGSSYKKEYCSWNICDFKSYWPEGGDKARRK